MILLLFACAGLLSAVPAEPEAPSTSATNEPTPYCDVRPCAAGTWEVSCSGCSPAWARTTIVTCESSPPELWEVDLLDQAFADVGGLAAARTTWPGDDWRVVQTSKETSP